jgi:hypothetical protein
MYNVSFVFFLKLVFSLTNSNISVGDICAESEERKPCVGLPYSICQQGLCLCQEGYFASNGLCKAELGEAVDSAEYCGAGEFRNGKCLCEKNRFYGANMRVCMKSEFPCMFSIYFHPNTLFLYV